MRFFLSILGVVIFIVVMIIIVASHGSSPSKKPLQKPINLSSYNYPGSSLTVITTGSLVADSNRQAVEITVSQDQVSIALLNTYNQTVSKTESFPNNSTAYGVFLSSMQNEQFTTSKLTTEKSIFATCPLGQTYQYQLSNTTKIVSNLWATSCSNLDGNFDGFGSTIITLFNLQIPNYSSFMSSGVNNSL
jgi:hypothetical protein